MLQPASVRFCDDYVAYLQSLGFTPDAEQIKAAQAFETLYRALLAGVSANPSPPKLLNLWVRKSGSGKAVGLYLWGGVGRGKSMLMDFFAGTLGEHIRTRRQHFHAFMRDIHQRLFAFRQLREGDALPLVVEEVASECRVLCLDEMQVQDVADAMILARLFSGLMDQGVSVIFTSNRPPRELYHGGLQREQFDQFVTLLETRLPIVELAGSADYRLMQHQALARSYVWPRNAQSDDFLLAAWTRLTGNAHSEPLRIAVAGRVLRVDKHAGGVAWLTFGELCVRPLGAADYQELAAHCHTVLLQGVPALKAEDRNEAKRFVTLIDTLYDRRIKLVVTAQTAPEGIYAHGDGSFEFARTVSRLHEMQSDEYWGLAKAG